LRAQQNKDIGYIKQKLMALSVIHQFVQHSMYTLPRHLLQASNKHQIHSLQSTPVAVVLISQILFVARGKAAMKRGGLLAKEK
jgi:hypothetical protein